MFKFRGQRKDNGEWVVGWYWYDYASDTHVIHYDGIDVAVHKESLSVSTGKLDSTDTEIFASFPLDGVMTTGGDVVEQLGGWTMKACYDKFNSCFSLVNDGGYAMLLSSFGSASLTIIGKGGGNDN